MPNNIQGAAKALTEAANARRAASEPDPRPPVEPMGGLRALVLLAWLIGWPALAGRLWWVYGWRVGLAVGVFVLLTCIVVYSNALWELSSDGYVLDKQVGPDGVRRWRIGLKIGAQPTPAVENVIYLDGETIARINRPEHPNKMRSSP